MVLMTLKCEVTETFQSFISDNLANRELDRMLIDERGPPCSGLDQDVEAEIARASTNVGIE
jgi:hypothetical protein